MGFIVEQWETPPVSLTLNHLPFQGNVINLRILGQSA